MVQRLIILFLLVFVSLNIHDGILVTKNLFTRYHITNSAKEVKCLALNIYYEGRGEPYQGRLAIANATINRLRYDDYPKTICEVVYQPGQFSWTVNKHKFKNPFSWYQSTQLANAVYSNGHLGQIDDNTNGAVNFHLSTIHPEMGDMVKTVTIGHHVFFRPTLDSEQ